MEGSDYNARAFAALQRGVLATFLGPSENASPASGGVAFTLFPYNRSVLPGLVQPGIPGAGSLLYDPIDNKVFGTPGENGATPVFNGTTGAPDSTFDLPVSSPTMAFDPLLDEVFAAGAPWTVVGFRGSNDSIVHRNISVGHGPDSIVFDGRDDRLYVACQYDSDIWVLDPQNGSAIGVPIQVYSTPLDLLYEPKGDMVLVSLSAKRVLALNGSSEAWVPGVNWSVGGGPSSMALDPVPNLVYIGNSGSANVTVVNATSGTQIGTGITVGASPWDILYYPPTGLVLVSTGGGLYEINVTSNSVVNGSRAEPGAYGLAYDSESGEIYCSAGEALGIWASDYLLEFDPRTNLSGRELQLQFTFTASLFDPSNGEEYVVNPTGANGTGAPTGANWTVFGQSSILGINATTHRFTGSALPAGNDAVALALADANTKLYAADQTLSTISIDSLVAQTQTIVPLATGFSPDALGVDSRSDDVFVGGTGASNLSIINGSTGTVLSATVPVGNGTASILFDPVLDELFTANCGSDNVSVVDPSTLRPIGSGIPVGGCPTSLALDPTNGDLFVANENSANLTVINTTTGSSINSIGVGLLPSSVVFDTANGLVYVANTGSDTVSVVDPVTLSPAGPPIGVLPATAPANVGPVGLSIDPGTSEVYVPTLFGNAVFVIANLPGPIRLTVTTAIPEADVPLALSTNASGGQPPYFFRYSALPRGCETENSPVELCEPTQPGEFHVEVEVSDSDNHSAFAHVNLTVAPALTAGNLSMSPNPTDVGVPVSISVEPIGGTLPWSLSYSGLPSGCSSANLSAIRCDPRAAGDYLVDAVLTDRAGAEVSASAVLAVEQAPVIGSFLALPAATLEGSHVVLALFATGGVGPLSYAYKGLPVGCATANVSALGCVPGMPGNFTIVAEVTDSLGVSANASLSIQVNPRPLIIAPSITLFMAVPSSLILGASTIFVVDTSTTTLTPINYSFNGLPPGCSTVSVPALACTPTIAGTYRVTVIANDSAGADSASAQLVVAKNGTPSVGPPGPPGPAGSAAPWEVTLVVALASGFVGGIVASWPIRAWRRRRAHPPPVSPP
ncbi:MAG: hypothetical protein L3K16_08930 [Thermoplasmata archaeon]|nr:hypothetical protein [Thermoplasmata archaeon]